VIAFKRPPRLCTRWVWAGLLCGILLSALQPFIAVHFRQDGWEDEPGFRVRATDATVEYVPDDRPDHPTDRETTMYVPLAANIDLPNAFDHGLDMLGALVLFLAPLTIVLLVASAPRPRHLVERAARYSGPSPPAWPWRRLPPVTAPPSPTA